MVSNKGAKVHAQFDLTKNANNYLVRNMLVNLPNDVSDLEVRFCVGENDEIKLFV